MHIGGNNWALWIGKDLMRGPPFYEFCLGWNDVRWIEQREPGQGERRYLDYLEFRWRWPRGWKPGHWLTKASRARNTSQG